MNVLCKNHDYEILPQVKIPLTMGFAFARIAGCWIGNIRKKTQSNQQHFVWVSTSIYSKILLFFFLSDK